MIDTTRCPYCGSPESAGAGHPGRPRDQDGAIDSLYQEVRRIREIAEDGGMAEARRRIAELTHEVHELRETVARLRAGASACPSHAG